MSDSKLPKTENKPDFEDAVNPEGNGNAIKEVSQEIARLSEDIVREKGLRREERFGFIVLCILLLDVVFFSVMDNFAGPLALLILELIILIPLAKTLGMDEAVRMMDSLVARLTHTIKSPEN